MPPRKRPSPSAPPTTPDAGHPEASADRAPRGKGRPTPKRKEAEAARRRPIVPDTRGDAKARKAAERQRRLAEQKAMLEGDERYLPARDKGPVRRMARDVVDSRRNFGDYFLWVAIGLMVALLALPLVVTGLGEQGAVYYLATVNYLTMAAAAYAVIDGWLLARRLRKVLGAKFPPERIPRGTVMYGVLRAYQLRRMRLPKPKVERGATVR
ncbi:MAG: DUF3043 domain-containing protein [Actinomycetales bacterium]|nr:DUF3043 domain-containing protein [Actinomycetales bacterium]